MSPSSSGLNDMVRAGLSHHQSGELAVAEGIYRRVLEVDPRHADALHLLGMVAFQAGRHSEADGWIRSAIAIKPEAASYHLNLGNVLHAQGRLAEAGASYQRALLLRPDVAEVHLNLGNIFRELGDLDSSVACYRRAQAVNPAQGEAAAAESMVLLLKGEFAAGWEKFERRWGTADYDTPMRAYDVPLWKGETPLPGRLLIWGEQGIGDETMFAGLVQEVLRRGHRCVLECDERLKPLFSRSFPEAEVVAGVDATRLAEMGIAAHVPSGSLPALFRRAERDFAGTASPYLRVDAGVRNRLRERYSDGRKLVGVAWHTKNRKSGASRSIDLGQLGPLFAGAGIRWVSLQYGDHEELEGQIRAAGAPILVDRDVDQLTDIDGFAAQVAAMDLVVTIDNSTAHLSGALGVATWVLLPFAPDWRWLEGREDSPWYPTMRLFRQTTRADWQTVVRRVEGALPGAMGTGPGIAHR